MGPLFGILSCIFIAKVSAIAIQKPGELDWNAKNFLEDEIFDGARAIAGPTSCGILGHLSGVICVTDSKFKIPGDNFTIYACPISQVCADSPYVCIQNGIPACRAEQRCGVCLANATNICLGLREYAACKDDSSIKFCPASRPYCTMLYDDEDILHQDCSDISDNTCTMNLITTTRRPPNSFVCTTYGKFLDYTDSTCKTYVYCYDNNGEMAGIKYTCERDLIFNEEKGKCVSPSTFECNL